VTYSLHTGAEQDLADALDFYIERAGLLVARRFLDEFLRVAELLTLNWLEHTDHQGPPCISAAHFSVLSCVSAP
jgi:plasmid stabilization system protein ParE